MELERVKAERDVVLERFSLLSRSAKEGMWDWEIESNRAWWSDAMYTTFGLDPSLTASYESWASFIHPDDRERVVLGFERALVSDAGVWEDEYRMVGGNNRIIDVYDRGYVVFNEHRKPIRMVGMVMDITERRALEGQLRHSQKMEAIGQLAGGIAHDFNNMLQAVALELALLQATPNITSRAVGHAHEIRLALERAKGLTRQLLLFSRRESMRPELIDINQRVIEVTRMLRRVLGEQIRIEPALASKQIPAEVDPSMLDQVIVNLAVNARDAMANGGTLSLSTAVCDHPGTTTRGPGRYACITVRDTGSGIEQDVMPRIFEPFFTTKHTDGTGLGLATVHGIVEQHRGWIEVESNPGQGTTFRVFLPAHRSAVIVAVDAPASEETGGRERILVVEDDAAVRRAMCALLESQGYFVVAADNGTQALATWDDANGKFDLVLTDLVMPGGIRGHELAARLAARTKDVRLIYITGHARDINPGGGFPVLHKPVDPDELLVAIRKSFEPR
jgi:signal transduction histidine kinase